MKTRLAYIVGTLILVGGAVLAAWMMAAPQAVSSAEAETFARANQLFDAGNNRAAANLYEQLIANGIESAAVSYNLGVTYRAMGNEKGAADMFEKAHALAPRDARMAALGNVSGIPLTRNEGALLLMAGLGFGAILVVLARQRYISNFSTNV